MTIMHENALVAMHAPVFLLLSGVFAAAIALGMHRWRARRDETVGMRLPELPEDPDPYELACLSGGAHAMASLAVHDMARRGWLEVGDESSVFASDEYIKRAPDHPPVSLLRPLELEVWRHTEQATLMSSLMGSVNLPGHLEEFAQLYRERLAQRRLIEERDAMDRARALVILGTSAAALPGLYRAGATWSAGGEAWGVYLVFGVLCGALVYVCGRPRARTDLGERYLEALRAEYAQMHTNRETWGEAVTAHLQVLAALYGTRVLSS